MRAGPAAAFDRLYTRQAASLTRQAFLLCGHRRLAERAVVYAFHRAWERWPEVAVDPDPAGWVRAAAHDYALSPWHQLVPGRRGGEPRAVPPEDRGLLEALLSLPRCYRRSLVLHDGVGLRLPETAAETEATTRAAALRILHARTCLAARLPGLAETAPRDRGALLTGLLRDFAAGHPAKTCSPAALRASGERRTRRWTWAAYALVATAVSTITAVAVLTG
ncbi:SigE family RNA polymerase sigma factor [Streptomyces johnsoniae]|uniref:RNA polymerase subunit sigma-70 n=1 Tax=Streptomyces johnsoniae TaxID=3075532 RepID=A0ABU2S3V7_9ACTN|nr:RNA polymerase subunit sigma-70 [Streptomyces sp. DSM 41886]MDT0443664.1 RNA polymerase subunit sigma-70 [Streptomyces sp. DSM 41886]